MPNRCAFAESAWKHRWGEYSRFCGVWPKTYTSEELEAGLYSGATKTLGQFRFSESREIAVDATVVFQIRRRYALCAHPGCARTW
jgi:hypothetical protein